MWQGTVYELVLSYSLAGLPGPDPSPIDHPWNNLGWWVHDLIPSQLPHFPNLIAGWFNNDNSFHKGRGRVQPKASFKHAQKAHRKYS